MASSEPGVEVGGAHDQLDARTEPEGTEAVLQAEQGIADATGGPGAGRAALVAATRAVEGVGEQAQPAVELRHEARGGALLGTISRQAPILVTRTNPAG